MHQIARRPSPCSHGVPPSGGIHGSETGTPSPFPLPIVGQAFRLPSYSPFHIALQSPFSRHLSPFHLFFVVHRSPFILPPFAFCLLPSTFFLSIDAHLRRPPPAPPPPTTIGAGSGPRSTPPKARRPPQ